MPLRTGGTVQQTAEDYLQANMGRSVSRLVEFLRIPSVSTDPACAGNVTAAARWVADRLNDAGLSGVELLDTGGHPAVYGEWLGAPGRPTILVYGHYDVQPPDPLDQWYSPPFEPEIRDDRIYARGASDDKGPVFIPITVAEAFLTAESRLPANVKFLVEGEEEVGSAHLDELIATQAAKLAADFALSADGAMWRSSEPSLTVGARGIACLNVEVRGPRSRSAFGPARRCRAESAPRSG